MMNKKLTVAEYMAYLTGEKIRLANSFLDWFAAQKTEKTQEELYNTLTIEELENYVLPKKA